MNQQPTIRRARASDVPAINTCARAAFHIYTERIGQEPAPMRADYAHLVAHADTFVLADDATLYGFVVLHAEPPDLLLETVAVDPAHQGRGFGRQLLAFVEEHARAMGAASIHLYTNELMTENIALYERRGFAELARRSEDGFRRVYMAKQLQ